MSFPATDRDGAAPERRGRVTDPLPEIKVILLEADPSAAERASRSLLASRRRRFAVRRAGTIEQALELLPDGAFGVVLVGVGPPPEAALEQIARLAVVAGNVPVIAIGDLPEDAIAVEAIRHGAEDYLLRRDALYPALPRILEYAAERRVMAERCRGLTERRTEAEALLSTVLEIVDVPTAIVDEGDRFVAVNPAFARAFGWSLAEMSGRPVRDLLRTGASHTGSDPLLCRDGAEIPVAVTVAAVPVAWRRWRVATFRPDALTGPGDPEAFERRFAELFGQRPGRMVAGRLQMIRLDKVRDTLGECWESRAERVLAFAESVIRARLSSEDMLARNRDGEFIVCFSRLTEEEAWFKAQAIEREIRARLIGEADDSCLADVVLETHAVEIEPEEAARPADIADLITAKLAREAERLRRDANRTLMRVFERCTLAPRPVLTAAGDPAPMAFAEFDAETRAQLGRVLLAAADEGPRLQSEIDMLRLGRAAAALYRGVGRDPGGMLIVEVSFGTLYGRTSREKYLSICRRLSEPVRHALVLCVCGIPANILPSRVTELMSALRPFARGRMVRLASPQLGNIGLRDSQVGLVALPSAVLDATVRHGGSALEKLLGELRLAGARLLADGAATRAEAAALARRVAADLVALD